MDSTRLRRHFETWMERARAAGSVAPVEEHVDGGLERRTDSLPAWDPYEVWLHRIRKPRELRRTRS